MISSHNEIARLRWTLQGRGFTTQDINGVCDRVERDIDDGIVQIVRNATEQAISYAEQIGAHQFIHEVTFTHYGDRYEVGTISGRTDFSTNKIENLPNLLKNAKTAADGSRYKVIPVKNKTGSSKMGTSSFVTAINQQSTATERRQQLAADTVAHREARLTAMMQDIKTIISTKSQPESKYNSTRASGDVTFRTASSKQNASTSWVIPEQDRDMTQFLIGLNNDVASRTDQLILDTVSYYEREYY